MQPVPRSFQAHRPVLDEAWPAQPPGSPRYDPKQNFRLPLELEILTNRRCALNPQRMRSNLDLSGGMISGEAIMLELGKTIGRQHAHDVVYQAAQAAASQNLSFPDRLAADHRVTAHLSQSAIDALLDPASHTGLSASIAHQQAEVARRFASELHAHLQS